MAFGRVAAAFSGAKGALWSHESVTSCLGKRDTPRRTAILRAKLWAGGSTKPGFALLPTLQRAGSNGSVAARFPPGCLFFRHRAAWHPCWAPPSFLPRLNARLHPACGCYKDAERLRRRARRVACWLKLR